MGGRRHIPPRWASALALLLSLGLLAGRLTAQTADDWPRVQLRQRLTSVEQQLVMLRESAVLSNEQYRVVQCRIYVRQIAHELLTFALLHPDDAGAAAGVLGNTLVNNLPQFDALFARLPPLQTPMAPGAPGATGATGATGASGDLTEARRREAMHAGMAALLGRAAAPVKLTDARTYDDVLGAVQQAVAPLLDLGVACQLEPAVSAWLTPLGLASSHPTARQLDELATRFRTQLSAYPGQRQVLTVLDALKPALEIEAFRPQMQPMYRRMSSTVELLVTLRQDAALYPQARGVLLDALETALSAYVDPRERSAAGVQLDRLLSLLPALQRINTLRLEQQAPTAPLEQFVAQCAAALRDDRSTAPQWTAALGDISSAMLAYRLVPRPNPGPQRDAYLALLQACDQAETQLFATLTQFVEAGPLGAWPRVTAAVSLLQKRAGDLRCLDALTGNGEAAARVSPAQAPAIRQLVETLWREAAGPDRVPALLTITALDEQVRRFTPLLHGKAPRLGDVSLEQALQQARQHWASAWARRDSAAAGQWLEPLLALVECWDGWTAFETARREGWLNRWAAVELDAEALNLLAQTLGPRLEEARQLGHAAQWDALNASMTSLERDVSYAWPLLRAARMQQPALRRLPTDYVGAVGQLAFAQPREVWPPASTALLARLCLYLNELAQPTVQADLSARRQVVDHCRQLGTQLRQRATAGQ